MNGYTDADVKYFNTEFNSMFNDANFTVAEGEYKGYQVKLDLNFTGVDDEAKMAGNRNTDMYENNPIGNSIQKGNTKTHTQLNFEIVNNADGTYSYIGGVTSDDKTNNNAIVMNEIDNDYMNILHEIFHSLGLTHPPKVGADHGVMHYPPLPPDAQDAWDLIINHTLKTILK